MPPTLELLKQTIVYQDGLRQDPTQALDLDGYKELALYLNVQNLEPANGSLTVRVAHSARNRSGDFTELTSWPGLTTAQTSWTYETEFYRYLTLKAEWSSSATPAAEADVELLIVPKK
jgi:hypothetical protein